MYVLSSHMNMYNCVSHVADFFTLDMPHSITGNSILSSREAIKVKTRLLPVSSKRHKSHKRKRRGIR